MRKAINENQTVQVVLVGVLVLIAGYLFMTRIAGGSGESAAPATESSAVTPVPSPAADSPSTSGSASAGSTAPQDSQASSAPGKGSDAGASTAGNNSADVSAASGGAAGGQGAVAASGDGSVAGPGLPSAVAAAYDSGKTVVLLVVRQRGIDDRKLRSEVRGISGAGDTAVFVTRAKGIAKYSRIAQGVEIDRVPALVVIEPKRLTKGPLPAASVSYGYRGPQTIAQAVRDADYNGPENLPYYPK